MIFTSLSAAILAGGKAERMLGQDKGLLLYQDKPMVLWISSALRGVVDEVFINANRNLEHYAEFGYEVILDGLDYQGKGPLSGLFTCLAFAKTSHLLVSPCDTPRISSEAFARLKQASQSRPETIHYLSAASGIHPLHAILPTASALAALKHFFDKEQGCSVMAFYEAFGCQSVIWEDDAALLNVNTSKQLK
ncbi:molybdenum cofactor guanylyltransferase [Marinomonas sp. M1K-6]|uniref:Molybdenum cofactor guanylyltransferase n=1 Tax=Marinomonas profundi TaxID=2726122 RepID=A0A847QYZ0_9GAMM|nr:molybdenum cofactor guanylyltransferase [Marinomonas profundi]NLQ16131.1 molybdenum cofactor guanylyltransferase [Marinomonas profundi]UDV03285.1 molybdenum cofactor guanylyltransferase [Marinomonas profundi]